MTPIPNHSTRLNCLRALALSSLVFYLPFCPLPGGAQTTDATASVTTDRQDYPPFSYVDITGAGFQPGETVSNQIVQIAGPSPGTAYAPWEVVADTNGNFFTTWYVFTDE